MVHSAAVLALVLVAALIAALVLLLIAVLALVLLILIGVHYFNLLFGMQSYFARLCRKYSILEKKL